MADILSRRKIFELDTLSESIEEWKTPPLILKFIPAFILFLIFQPGILISRPFLGNDIESYIFQLLIYIICLILLYEVSEYYTNLANSLPDTKQYEGFQSLTSLPATKQDEGFQSSNSATKQDEGFQSSNSATKQDEGFQTYTTLINKDNNGTSVIPLNTVTYDYNNSRLLEKKIFEYNMINYSNTMALPSSNEIFKYFSKSWNFLHPGVSQTAGFTDYKNEDDTRVSTYSKIYNRNQQNISEPEPVKEGFADNKVLSPPSALAQVQERDGSITTFWNDNTYNTVNDITKVEINGDYNSSGVKDVLPGNTITQSIAPREPRYIVESRSDGTHEITDLKGGNAIPGGGTLTDANGITRSTTIAGEKFIMNGSGALIDNKPAPGKTKPTHNKPPADNGLINTTENGLTDRQKGRTALATTAIMMCFANQVACLTENTMNHGSLSNCHPIQPPEDPDDIYRNNTFYVNPIIGRNDSTTSDAATALTGSRGDPPLNRRTIRTVRIH